MTDPTKAANLKQISFRFPHEHRFTPDRVATEYRFLLLAYLNQAHRLLSEDPRVQEFRDCVVRIQELANGLTAHEFSLYARQNSALPDEEKQEASEQEDVS